MHSIESVVSNGVCVGCGGCGAITDGRIPITLHSRGYYEADLSAATSDDLELASRVCPFSDDSKNEDVIAQEVFPALPSDSRIGRHLSMFAGRLADDEALPSSSSGGLTTWIARQLLSRGEIDGLIHVSSTASPMFGYSVSHTDQEFLDGRKSKYHPASFAEALNSIRGNGKTYAMIGVPCAVRSARLIIDEDAVIADQLKYLIGIVCGHMKSAAYAESFAWQLGIEPDDIETVDFRIKNPALTSRQYSFGAKQLSTGEWKKRQTLSFVGGSWGHAVFQLNACNYCDDVFAETADVVIGDAWLSKYEVDWRGTNVVVTRDPVIDSIFREGLAQGEFTADSLDLDSTGRTQAGNFSHRRDGLAVRLADDERAGRWAPRKRVAPGYDHVTPDLVDLIRKRRHISEVSHDAFAAAKEQRNLQVYYDAVLPLIYEYQSKTKMPFAIRVRNKLQRELWKVFGRLSGFAPTVKGK